MPFEEDQATLQSQLAAFLPIAAPCHTQVDATIEGIVHAYQTESDSTSGRRWIKPMHPVGDPQEYATIESIV